METYVFNANVAKHALSGGEIDRYIYNTQDGNGIGSFFAPILKAIVPIAKTIGNTLLRAAKPVAREGIKGMATAGLGSLANKTVASRKRKSTSKVRTAKRR